MHAFQILPCGDSALTIEFASEISEAVHEQVSAMVSLLEETKLTGVQELIPTYRAIMVCYSPWQTDFALLKQKIERLGRRAMQGNTATKVRCLVIPVCYGGDFGPDLDTVAQHNGLSAQEVVHIHTTPTYLIYMLGFTPGFAYLGGMDHRIATPRLTSPRTRIPAGSVGIAGDQTGMYPIDSPGGWQLIGRTPLKLYQPEQDPPVLLRAGDRIRFRAIGQEEFTKITNQIGQNTYVLEEEVGANEH